MNKPKMKREVSVTTILEGSNTIYFYATRDAVTEFEMFGRIEPQQFATDYYSLLIDTRFDFAEVVGYAKNYG